MEDSHVYVKNSLELMASSYVKTYVYGHSINYFVE